jgi:hypothetical protein
MLEVTEGLVEVLPRGGDGWLPASLAQELEPGTTIRTGAGGAALLTFFDGSMTAMQDGTELTIERLRALEDGAGRVIVLRQARGLTQHRVEPADAPGSRFEVRSPLAVASVRGTEFAVAVEEDGTTEVTLREGRVDVRARRETIELLPGWATIVEPERPPATPFAAPTPMAEDVFPTWPARETAASPTASATETATEVPSLTWTPTVLVPTATPMDEPTHEPSPEPKETPQPVAPTVIKPTATLTVITPTATPTEGPSGDDDVPTPVGPMRTPKPTPVPTATEKPEPTEQPTEQPTGTSIPTPSGPTAVPPTPTEERPGDDDVPTPGGPGG